MQSGWGAIAGRWMEQNKIQLKGPQNLLQNSPEVSKIPATVHLVVLKIQVHPPPVTHPPLISQVSTFQKRHLL